MFALDREVAVRELRADVRACGSEYDPELEAAGGVVHGTPVRALIWSAQEGRVIWWRYDAARARWDPEGFDRALVRKLRVELSDANRGQSVEEVLADRLEAM